jgi:hypothetical protein
MYNRKHDKLCLFLYEDYEPLHSVNVAKEIANYLTEQYPEGVVCWNSSTPSFPDAEDDGFMFFVTTEQEQRWHNGEHKPEYNSEIIFVNRGDSAKPESELFAVIDAEARPHVHVLHERDTDEIDFAAIHDKLLHAARRKEEGV